MFPHVILSTNCFQTIKESLSLLARLLIPTTPQFHHQIFELQDLQHPLSHQVKK